MARRIAKLPGNIEIAFPAGTPDKVIDKHVEMLNAKPVERDTTLVKLTSSLFAKISTQFETLKEAIYKLPDMIVVEKPDMTKIEKIGANIEGHSLAIIRKMGVAESIIASIRDGIAGIIKAINSTNQQQQIDALAKEVRILSDAVYNQGIMMQQAQKENRSATSLLVEKQTKLLLASSSDNALKMEKVMRRKADEVIEVLTAERVIVRDKKTDRPIGTKIKV